MLKEEVLSLLLNAREPVSGEGICKTFGVTRAAVWKTIDQLRQEGYGIDAAPKRGYTLAFVPERLDTALVRAHLSGHPWQALTTAVPSVDSTNNACKRLAAEGAPDGTAILTGCQTAGRGRRGRTFVSPPGGLYFSVILRPHAKPEALMHLTAMAGILLGAGYGALSQGVYVLIGLVGVPIFALGGGFSYVLQPTFGFLLGLIPSAFVIGKLAKRPLTFWGTALAMLAGLAVLYAIGVPYMALIANAYLGKGLTFWQVIKNGMLIYLPGDLLKIALGSFLCVAITRRLPQVFAAA